MAIQASTILQLMLALVWQALHLPGVPRRSFFVRILNSEEYISELAVSASLIEKERQVYIDAGFDGWILKPIAFHRLSEIMKGLVDREIRQNLLYRPGRWEHGGWFDNPRDDAFSADTKPSEQPPMTAPAASMPSNKVAKAAAAPENPFVKEENESEQSQEQLRLAHEQGEDLLEPPTRPDMATQGSSSSEETVIAASTKLRNEGS